MQSRIRCYSERLLAVARRELDESEELKLRRAIEGDGDEFNDLLFLSSAYSGLGPSDALFHPSRKLLADHLWNKPDSASYPDARAFLDEHVHRCEQCQSALQQLRHHNDNELRRIQSMPKANSAARMKAMIADEIREVLDTEGDSFRSVNRMRDALDAVSPRTEEET